MDTITITLPISGKTVEIRNYTTRKDDEKSEAVLYAGVKANHGTKGEQTIEFPMANIMASEQVYVPRLVVRIDGDNKNIEDRLGDLRTPDYEAVEKAVGAIVNENSPKAKEAKNASKNDTDKS